MCECSWFLVINYVKHFDVVDFRLRTGIKCEFAGHQNGIFTSKFVSCSKILVTDLYNKFAVLDLHMAL
jgi:hypothetical protein